MSSAKAHWIQCDRTGSSAIVTKSSAIAPNPVRLLTNFLFNFGVDQCFAKPIDCAKMSNVEIIRLYSQNAIKTFLNKILLKGSLDLVTISIALDPVRYCRRHHIKFLTLNFEVGYSCQDHALLV